MGARAFFESLESRAAGLEGVDHAYRFEIDGEGVWLVSVRGGKVTVVEGGDGAADATIRARADVFDRIVSGSQNPVTAYMTGKVRVDGDMGAVLELQKLLR